METPAQVDNETQPHEPTVRPEESFRRALDVSPAAMVITNAQKYVTHANKAAKDILNIPPEALIGRRIEEVPVHFVTGEAAPLKPEETPMYRALAENKEVINEEIGVVTPLGELKFLLVSAAPLMDEHGCAAGVVFSFVDISESKREHKSLEESERRLRLILENMSDIVFLLDTQASLIYVSPSIEKLSGWKPEELMNQGPFLSSLGKHIYPDDIPKVADLWERSLKGETLTDAEFRGITKDGRVFWFSASWSPVTDEEGRIIAVQGSVRDITDRVLARDAKQRLEEDKRNFYRITISAFTGGKLEIVDDEEITNLMKEPEVSVDIKEPEDSAKAREAVREVARRHDLNEEKTILFLLAVGEAVTNAVRHGQGGKVLAGYNGEHVWVAVVDRGPGIEALALPRVTLEKGYSGKISLGMGYSMMLELANKVWLSTGPEGTTVLITCCRTPNGAGQSLDDYPDTW